MALSQQSLCWASSRERMDEAPKPKPAHQHFPLSSLGPPHGTEWCGFFLSCGGQSRSNSWQIAVMVTFLLKLGQLTFSPSDFIQWFRIQKQKCLPLAWVCVLFHLSIPLGYGLGYLRHFLWSPHSSLASGLVHSKDKVQGWRERKRRANNCSLGSNKLLVCQGADRF